MRLVMQRTMEGLCQSAFILAAAAAADFPGARWVYVPIPIAVALALPWAVFGVRLGYALAEQRVRRLGVLRTLAYAFWWSMAVIAGVWLASLVTGCALDVGAEGDQRDPHKRPVLELDADDEPPPDIDGGAQVDAGHDAGRRDAAALERDAAELARDAGPEPARDAAPPSALAGAWQVTLRQTLGKGCNSLPAAAVERWELSADQQRLTVPQGVLERLPGGFWWATPTGTWPTLRVVLEQDAGALRGERIAEQGGAACYETWDVEGVRP